MAEYESIHGTRVKYLTSDPTLDSSTEGQVWYNSTSGTNKVLSQIKAWSSGGNMGTARYTIGSCGSQTAALGFGGYSGAYKADTEEYNGFSWSTGGNLNLARFNPGGAGSQTAALAFGGFINGPPPSPTNATEEYDGSSWTAQNTMPTAVRNPAGSGTQTAGLSSGGNAGPPGVTGVTQEYDGTNWTTSPGSMNVARENATGFGLQTATIVAGGNEPGVNNAEQYDGSTWTAVSNLNSPVYSLASAANGTTSHGITFGGASPAGTGLSQTEEWDGSTWTISPASLAAGKWKLGGAGTASAGLKFAGGPPPSGNVATEEYNSNINAITQASWAAGGTMSTPKLNGGQGIGIKTAAAVFGGNQTSITYPYVNTTYEYDGSSWSGGGNMNNTGSAHGAFGTQTAGLAIGSYRYPPNVSTTNVEEYNGSSWTAKPAMSVSRYYAGGAGISTAGLAIGGTTKPPGGVISTVEHYDGEGWTGGGALPANRESMSSGGTQTAAIVAGGNAPPTYSDSLEYNGSAWTSTASLNGGGRSGNYGNGGPTAQTEMLVSGGGPGTITTAEIYNGTSWSITASLGTARNQHMNGQAGNSGTNGAIVAGGVAPPTGVNTSETFTDTTSVATASTLTTS